uniref:Uncharacterized protein n=1 Tax=Panagrolaimus sp. ES5 TaxID=591445 RepID=A0AC34GRK1_9BILA
MLKPVEELLPNYQTFETPANIDEIVEYPPAKWPVEIFPTFITKMDNEQNDDSNNNFENLPLIEKIEVEQNLNVSINNDKLDGMVNTHVDNFTAATDKPKYVESVETKDKNGKQFHVEDFWKSVFSVFNESKNETQFNMDKLENKTIFNENKNDTVADDETIKLLDELNISFNDTENVENKNEIQTEIESSVENDKDEQEYDYNGIISNKIFSEKINEEPETYKNIFLSTESDDKNDTVQNEKQKYANNETLESEGIFGEIIVNDANFTANKTSNDSFEGSALIDDELVLDEFERQSASMDDEDGDDDFDTIWNSQKSNPIKIAPLFGPTILPIKIEPKMKEMHKCFCSEIKECLSEAWESYKEESDENMLTKCSLTFLKDDCTFNGFAEKILVEAVENKDDVTMENCSCTENKQSLFNKKMQKCFNRNSCFLQNSELLLNKMRPFCVEKVKKLTILNALNLSNDQILALKSEYVKTFDEEFEDGRITNPGRNIISRFFYGLRNKFCETF